MNNGFAMAYDAGHGQVVLSGEVEQGSQTLMQTWVWNGTYWALLSPMNSPPARYGHAMAYDSAHGQVVLFGGCCYQLPPMDGEPLGDTWFWNGSNWTQQSPANSPPARYFHGMTYDTAQGQTVLFGGLNDQLVDYGDTWLWDGSNWTEEFRQTSPPAQDSQGMSYDSAAGEVVLYGGIENGVGDLSGLWTWSTPATVPPPPTPPAISSVVRPALGDSRACTGVLGRDLRIESSGLISSAGVARISTGMTRPPCSMALR
jgi:hypothetical protein